MLARCLTMLVVLALAVPYAAHAASSPTFGLQEAHSASSSAFSHIYVIMEENTSYDQLIGNKADAPYINYLARTYSLAANYYGVTHPSLPNHVAATAGDFFGSHSDAPNQVFDATNLVDQLEANRKTWAGYFQAMPSAGYTGFEYPAGNGALYVNKHNPFVLFKDILDSPTRLQNMKPMSSLASDLASGTMPNLVWLAPDICHIMHGMPAANAQEEGMPWCTFTSTTPHGLIQHGDAYLKDLVGQIMTSPAWTSDSAIVVTWDEDQDLVSPPAPNHGYATGTGCCGSPVGQGGGRVPTIVITSAPHHVVSFRPYNHYSLLRTIEDNFGLGCLLHSCDASVQPMTDVFSGTGSSYPLENTHGLGVPFTSTHPGQGYVLFGPGPGCTGLVFLSGRDLGAGTTQHTVLVTGDEMNLSSGGLLPGQMYWYETMTVSPAGVEVDNNGGQCYPAFIAGPYEP